MSIQFSPDDWARIKKDYTKWWNRELDRPLIPVLMQGKDPGRPQPNIPLLSQKTCADLRISAADIIDRIDYELSQYEYLGDAFPFVNFDSFGPGVVAAFLGANLDNSTGGVWFHPKKVVPIDELHFEYDADNIWLNRIKGIYYEGIKRWQGQVLMGMPDLGGILDIISTFRPSENLMYDLYDDPDEVKRVIWEIHGLWIKFYNELNSILQPVNPGYCDWAKIYSASPSYVLQSDFSYMIGPQTFDEFVKPELKAMCRILDNTLYHLDGVGELNHLDSILSIKELNAVQWVPGDGKPLQPEWPEVLLKIHNAGKNLQLFNGLEALSKVEKILGTSKGIHLTPITGQLNQKTEYISALKKYNVI